eukprot:TRINITY_DN3708_c0_g3_i1.p1 TRINITY_DN3708_c0_g3~~TRINITY_DN3708_c0_g3_i1.p1  ORF type:complete len:424 (+),score=89.48 TRINITY_DN3708_c0_g3_i1:129-1274(+)
MAGVVEKDRRRLSVGSVPKMSAGGARPVLSKSESELAEVINGLVKCKQYANVVSISSKTDNDLSRRKSFAEKDSEYEGTFASEDVAFKWVNDRGIGFHCKKGNKPESPNQDSFNLIIVDNEWALYGVFDGHGPLGHYVSDVARDKLVSSFVQHEKRDEDTKKAFMDCFSLTQDYLESSEVTSERKIDTTASGTTCTMAFHDFRRETITFAHVGDSRAIMQLMPKKEVVEELTTDHKPDLPEEKKRIEAANGRVVFDGFYNHRVFAKDGMYPGLNMSRALGDVLAHKKAGLTAVPDVRTVNLKDYSGSNEGLRLLICSDGVWEFIDNKQAFDICDKKDAVADSSRALVQESYDFWMADSQGEISDDITCILVDLKFGASSRS